jgi:hypothetical protein
MHLARTIAVTSRDDGTGVVTIAGPIEQQSPKVTGLTMQITFSPLPGAPPELKVGQKVLIDIMTR